MGFDDYLLTREMAERAKAARESALASKDTQLRNRSPQLWRELQEAVRKTAEGKVYKGEPFVWRPAKMYPACLMLKNVSATFAEREWDSDIYTVLLGGVPGMHATGSLYAPDPEFIDVRYKGMDRWLVGASTEPMRMSGEGSAAEAICKALVTYFDEYQKIRRPGWIS